MRDLLGRAQIGIQKLKKTKARGRGAGDDDGAASKTTEDIHMHDPDLVLDLERVKVEGIISNDNR